MDSKNRIKLLIGAILLLSYLPIFMMLRDGFGFAFFFPSYIIATTIYAFLAIFFVWKIKIKLAFPLLLLVIIVKLVLAQIILIYLFTPMLDYVAMRISVDKFCNPATIELYSKSGNSSLEQFCNKLLQIL